MQPIRYITRHHSRKVTFIEGECTDIDVDKKILHVNDNTNQGVQTVVKYDKLVIACGAENATFGIPGVKENACFLKESWDAKKIRAQLMDCIENAAFPGQSEEEIEKLLHMVVVGGGPTGVEYAAELYDFLHEDLSKWYPDIAGKIKITLVEAMPSVLPMFSKELIEYTQKQFSKPDLRMRLSTTVKRVNPKDIVVLNKKKEEETIPYGSCYFKLINRIIGLGYWKHTTSFNQIIYTKTTRRRSNPKKRSSGR
jgi:NADH:ubiquinone reductase (non-electrogenic)